MLSQFHSYLQNRLQDSIGAPEDTSTIQACIGLVQDFRETTKISSSAISRELSPICHTRRSSPTTHEDVLSGIAASLTQEGDAEARSDIQNLHADNFNEFQIWHEPFEFGLDQMSLGIVIPEIPSSSQQLEGHGQIAHT